MSEKGKLSRRGFLKAMGAGGGVLAGGKLAGAMPTTKGSAVAGPDKTTFTLRVNRETRDLNVEPRTTLLNALRHHLNVTGPKEVCDRGACGACTVWQDGKPIVACLSLAIDSVGREVTTVEGLGKEGSLVPLQRKFVEKEGLQCGYCIPGFIMSIQAHLRDHPSSTLDEVKEACAGNTCRCAAYQGMFAAAMAVVKGEKPEEDLTRLGGKELQKVLQEKGVPRVDGPEKVSGVAKYSSDIRLEGQLFARLLNSPFDRASVTRADLDAAKRVPGVRDVRLLTKSPRSIGQPVAVAFAEDPQAADEALGALRLRLEPVPALSDPMEAFEKGRVRESGKSPGIRGAIRAAAASVENVYEVNMVQHSALEPHGGTVAWKGEQLRVHESTQHVSGVQRRLAQSLRMPSSRIQVITDHVGGGFGAKIRPWSRMADAVKWAKELGVPVQCMNNRAGELLEGGGRIPNVVQVRLGAKEDGTLVGDWRKAWPRKMSPYWYRVDSACDRVRLNMGGIGPVPALRAPGAPPAQYVMECIMDDLAAELEMDPLELRLKNRPDLAEWFDIGARRIGWHRRPSKPGEDRGTVVRGIGVGCGEFAGSKGCNFTEVEVDRGTGVVRVKKVVVVFQGGFINRRAILNQVSGGTIMGLSWALLEERILDPGTCAMLNADMEFYKVMGSLDVPEIDIVLLGEEGRSSGAGEAPVVPTAGALSNAIYNALGVRVTRMPFTPPHVLEAMEG